jgi:hypothetical protein
VPGADVTLTDEAGKEAFAWWRESPSLVSRARAGDDGRLVLLGAPTGVYRLSAAIGARKLGPVRVEVVAGSAAAAVIE